MSNGTLDRTARLLLLISTACLVAHPLNAQQNCREWDKRFGGSGGEGNDPQCAVNLAGGGYLLGASSSSGITGDHSQATQGGGDYWVVKMDDAGTKVWDRNYGGSGVEQLRCVVATSDGGSLLAGKSSSGISGDRTEDSRGSDDYWIVKLDASGNKQWDKRFGSTYADFLYTALQAADGGFYLIGYCSNSGTSGDKTVTGGQGSEIWVVRTDAAGIKLWDKVYYGATVSRCESALIEANGDVVLGATTSSPTAFHDVSQPGRGGDDCWLLKINSSGTRLWDVRFGGADADRLDDVAKTIDGGYWILSSSLSGVGVDHSQPSQGNYDYWLIKTDASGALLWERRFGSPASDVATTVLPLADGTVLIGGYSAGGIGGDRTQASWGGGNDMWMVKVSATGNRLWDARFGGSGYDALSDLLSTTDNKVLAVGASDSPVSGDKSQSVQGFTDLWAVKIDGASSAAYFADQDLDGLGDPASPVLSCTAAPGLVANSSDPCPFTTLSIGTACDDANACTLNDVVTAACVCQGTVQPDTDGDGVCDAQDGCPGLYGQAGTHCDDHNPNTQDDRINSNCQCDGIHFPCLGWERRFGGSADDQATCAVNTSDGGFLIGGTSGSSAIGDHSEVTQGGTDYWIMKISSAGSLVWEKRFGSSADDNLNAIVTVSDGGILLVGGSAGGIGGDRTEASRGSGDYWIVRLDGAGTKLWDKRYGGAADDMANATIATSDGGFLIGGTSYSTNGGDRTESTRGSGDYWVVKINSAGTKLWDKRFGGTQSDELIRITELASGEFVLAGNSSSPLSGDKSQSAWNSSPDFWLLKMNAAGTAKVWDYRLGSNGLEQLTGMGVMPDGKILLSGWAVPQFNGINGNRTDTINGIVDLWTVACSPTNGSRVWDKAFGGDNTAQLGGMAMLPDGGAVLVAWLTSGVANDVSGTPRGGRDYWLLRMNVDGKAYWDQRFGGDMNDDANCVLVAPDGSLVVAGKSTSGATGDKSQPSQGLADFWVVKTTPTALVAYPDADGDTYGDADALTMFCGSIPPGYVQNALDCDDTNPAIYMNAVCNDGISSTQFDHIGADCTCAGTSYQIRVAPKVLLDGPFSSGTDLMADPLRTMGLIPIQEPFTNMGYVHVGGGGGEMLMPSALTISGNNAIVDWVLVELRSDAAPSSVIASRSALVQRDGDVVDMDGVSPVRSVADYGAYRIAIKHRNHLGCMTQLAVGLHPGSYTPVVDFTSASTVVNGSNARKTNGTKQTLWPGDVGRNGAVKYTGTANDRDPILVNIGSTTPNNLTTGYWAGDVNMDGSVKYTGTGNDRDVILLVVGGTTPNNTLQQQLP